jgi:anti-sigma regulatory factor (Ser/Thr protein kinase)
MMEDLSLHILDIAENAIASGASRVAVFINEDERRDRLTIIVRDNGRGMPRRTLRRVFDPFFSTKGKPTGLGLPFLAQAAEQTGGRVTIDSTPGKGTRVLARFRFGHIDRPPLSNMAGTITTLVLGHPEVSFRYVHRRNGRAFGFSGRRLLGFVRAGEGLSPEAIGALRKELREGLGGLGRS